MSTLSQWIKFLKTATVQIPVFFLTVQKIRSMLSSFPVYLFCIIRTTLSGVRVLNTEEACPLLKRKRVFPLIIFIFYLLIFWGGEQNQTILLLFKSQFTRFALLLFTIYEFQQVSDILGHLVYISTKSFFFSYRCVWRTFTQCNYS